MKRDLIKSTVIRSETIGSVNVEHACRICQLDVELFHELVVEGIFEFSSHDSSYWTLDPEQLATLRKAARLHRDLGVNPAGIALALELMRSLELMRALEERR